MVALYCGISLLFSLITFAVFRVSDGISQHFSVYNFVSVLKAVLIGELMTSVVLFTFTRLEGIPRSTPLVHALILIFGLILVRAIFSLSAHEATNKSHKKRAADENIIVIGMNRLSSLYIELLAACSPHQRRVIGVLDDRSQFRGHSVADTSVVGSPQQLDPVIDEFEVHGVRTHRVIVGGDENFLPKEAIDQIQQICARRAIALDFIPDLIGLRPLQSQVTQPSLDADAVARPTVRLSSYFLVKRIINFLAALALVIMLLPLWIVVSAFVLFDLGMPIFFWQQRVGLNGNPFLLYKFRTMRPPFDWRGQPIPEERRTSLIGRILRETRLDELPQLLNVLVGDMDLIGPRPLLPRDQPANPTIRLMVRPGITGWAQINGGTLLTPEEKDQLDEWYIRNASLWLDLRIIFITLFVLSGPRRQSVRARWMREQSIKRTSGDDTAAESAQLGIAYATAKTRMKPQLNS